MDKMKWVKQFTVVFSLTVTTLFASALFAGSVVTVEIVGLDHWPIKRALEPTMDMLNTFGDKIVVTEMDVDTKAGKARLKKAGLKGHIPVVIFVNGSYIFKINGQDLEFMNFPRAASSPMGIDGQWSPDELQQIISQLITDGS